MFKTNCMFNLINHQPDIDEIYLYAKDPYEAKYQFLVNKRESANLKHFDDSKLFLNIRTIGLIFIKTLKIIIQIKNKKYLSFLIIWLLICLLIKNII